MHHRDFVAVFVTLISEVLPPCPARAIGVVIKLVTGSASTNVEAVAGKQGSARRDTLQSIQYSLKAVLFSLYCSQILLDLASQYM